MPFAIHNQVGAPLELQILPGNLHFQSFCANLRSCDLQCQTDLTENPIFVEAASRIRRFHEFSSGKHWTVDDEAKLTALAVAAPKDSTSQLLLDIMNLWGKKIQKVNALSEIMGTCANEIGSKAIMTTSKARNQHNAETPYTLEQKMASLEETMKRKLGGELLSLQVELAAKKRRMNFSIEAVETLKRWFVAHSAKPYPSEEEKVQLSRETGISVLQVTNWFINMRKRNWDSAI